MHSHILPGIDDGAKTMEDSLAMIRQMAEMGYKRLIATPHIYRELYPNNSEIVLDRLALVRRAVQDAGIPVQIDAAAEYFMDEHFEDLLAKDDILTLPGGYVLVEMSFAAKSPGYRQIIFDMQLKGYKPILAHPERYPYLTDRMGELETLADGGCRMQLNLLSLGGVYGKGPQIAAEKMLKLGIVSMLGTDAHQPMHLRALADMVKKGIVGKVLDAHEFENKLLLD
jgi:protein-tyrosine phosphatase